MKKEIEDLVNRKIVPKPPLPMLDIEQIKSTHLKRMNSSSPTQKASIKHNLFILYHELKGTYVTDTGWGCMIRVGQMAFAQVLRRHQQVSNSEEMSGIINLFNDFDKTQPFSIHSIGRVARK